MTYEEFSLRLKELGLSKKDFANLTGLEATSVTNWKAKNEVKSSWVKSWLDNYEKALKFEKIKELVREF
ncbi:hypothetical protein CAV_0582 [Campylobacter avium LMG 24591]|uniref:XRE family transcriptional regulator n=1 Tax=Campylobacter avium LMG 24591 TaxID=522484 RepID=A0A222MWH0_9BACT|nr:hypothetical protein [Campylobacter avium]ASQ30249.1 hypothetical protein CAV_0582 [Campylobacter avium LMG 24591]OYD79347.1 hypothetical protein CAV8706_0584 [Campylobacter avium]